MSTGKGEATAYNATIKTEGTDDTHPTPDWYIGTTTTLAAQAAQADGNTHMIRGRTTNITAAIHLIQPGDTIKIARAPHDRSTLWDTLNTIECTILQ